MITLPENYFELILEIERDVSTVRYSIHVSYTQLLSSYLYFKSGNYVCGKPSSTYNNYEAVCVAVCFTRCELSSVYDSGTDVTDLSELRVFYR